MHLLLTVDEAEDLLALVQRAGFVAVACDLRRQLVTERLLPWDEPPRLSVQFDGVSRDIFEDAIAEAMYLAMQAAADQVVRQRNPPRTAGAADIRRS